MSEAIINRLYRVMKKQKNTPENLPEALATLARFCEQDAADFKSLECMVDYMHLVTCVYDYYGSEDLIADIRHGDATDSKGKVLGAEPWNDFVTRWGLPWRKFNALGEDIKEAA